MTNQLLSYEFYLKKCEQYGLQPLNFRTFITQLSNEQLQKFSEHVQSYNEWNQVEDRIIP